MRPFVPLCLALLGSVAAAFAQPVEVCPVPPGPSALSLNGAWQFKYVAGSELGPDVLFSDPDLGNTARWPVITVPGHWELQGFASPRYGKDLAEGTGLYRRTFRVPADWQGQRIYLRFDGVLYGFDAWVNGTKVGSWASAYNPVTFDITDALNLRADNVLAVRVATRSPGWEFDVNDCWALSGIYRDVTVFAAPAAHFQSCGVRTTLQADGSASLSVAVRLSAAAVIRGRLMAPDGRAVGTLVFPAGATNAATVALQVEHPRLWTAETPALYTLELALSSGQTRTEKIGLREVSIADGVLRLNGRPIKLRGVDHHDLWPEHGRVATEELMRRDLELMRAANINFIRTSHYPPHPRFLELCDEMGFYVMDEVPFGFGEEHLNDPAYRPNLLTRAQATVARDHDHVCVIVWSVGNENPNTPLTLATARRVKELDPTRPVCFPQTGSYFAKSYAELPADVDIYAPHYPATATVRAYAEKLTRPIIFTEYAHALGLASDQIQDEWAIMQASPRIAGGAIWMFQDQGILRAAAAGENPAATHDLGLAVWPDATHYYDSAGNLGMDGIVYSDRIPQVDYWQVRKVYSPVQITGGDFRMQPGINHVSLQVENRFDFRSLEGLVLAWTVMRNGRAGQSGLLPLHAAARTMETVTLPVDWPADIADDFAWLEVHCRDERGESFHERSFRLSPAKSTPPAAALAAGLPDQPLELAETPETFTVTHPGFTVTLQRASGEIMVRDPAGHLLATGPWPHAGRRFTEGEFMRAKKEQTWTNALLRDATGLETTATRSAAGIALRVRGTYPRPDAPGQALEGEINLLVKPDGAIEVGYDYHPVGGHGLLLEAGVGLVVPGAASEFQWSGAGPFAGYPGKDVLNEFGLYHLNRADLNFQGNRRGVDIALLTTPTGAGLALGGDAMDVAVERTGDDTILSHNAVISGRGTKFNGPDVFNKAEDVTAIRGKFVLFPLAGTWPARLTRWFGPPSAAQPFQPYYHSYDQ